MKVLDENEFDDTTDSTLLLGMEFDKFEDAWKFWVKYGGKMGFGKWGFM
jgi:hypothetical protein